MRLTVNLTTHCYDLWIEKGALSKLGVWITSLWERQKVAMITDKTVDEHYGFEVRKQLCTAGFEVVKFVISPGEISKSLQSAEDAYYFLAKHGLTRKDGILALGGGVVGDLAGFVASTYLRGIHFLQVPTTLLAQIDSSIGGKTAVNTRVAKNLVGSFAQPNGVLIDPDVLKTLEEKRVREGIAEIVKYAAIADVDLWKKLESYEDEWDLLAHAEEVIYACCEIKRQVVEEDEFDNGRRLILNFGHTIGHALEISAGFDTIAHGEGVALGMVQISKIAEQKGLMKKGITKSLIIMLKKFHLPVEFAPWEKEKLYQALMHDKKARGAKINIVLLEQIGKAKIYSVSIEKVKGYIK
ncbi:MAG: 3-dehydroquinate synthase [Streptococcaceae bacterium]|jgi:3-dehydroquinate synthase|nr:3-dehydroquinate synthase [Streptococcaceae bacterium]